MSDATTARFRLDGDVAVVTGGASGIGKTVALAYAESGATVVIADRNALAAMEAAAEIGHGASSVSMDVSDEASVKVAFDQIAAEHGGVDVLFNNAGVNRRTDTTELSLADWNTVVSVNMTGSFLAAREAARLMLKNGGGRIVNTASILGMSGGWYPNLAYAATKGAVINMTRALAIEWASRGIRVNAVAPGLVRTPFIAALTENPAQMKYFEDLTPLGRLGEPEDLVGPVLFLSTKASNMVTGQILAVDGGMTAH